MADCEKAEVPPVAAATAAPTTSGGNDIQPAANGSSPKPSPSKSTGNCEYLIEFLIYIQANSTHDKQKTYIIFARPLSNIYMLSKLIIMDNAR